MMNVRLAPRAWIPLAAGGVAAAAIGVALITVGPLAPEDASTPTPASHSTPTDGPTVAPTGTSPTAPTTSVGHYVTDAAFTLGRESGLSDDTALARMASPRTGETWHDPVEHPEYAAAFAPYSEFLYAQRYFSIVERNGYDIVVAARTAEPSGSYDTPGALGWLGLWQGFFEMRDGVPVLIMNPWEDPGPCVDSSSWLLQNNDQLVADSTVFYDSLSYPKTLAIDSQTTVTVYEWADWTSGCQYPFPGTPLPWERAFGNAGAADLVDEGLTELAGHGPLDVVRLEWPSQVTGLVNGQYYVRTPYDTLLTTYAAPDQGVFGAISWIDGHVPTNPGDENWHGLSPAAGQTCWDPTQFTREIDHVDDDWVLAGTSPTGVDVYVPVTGGNPVALSVYTRMSDKSSMDGWENVGPWSTSRAKISRGQVHTEEVPPYAYSTYEAFLADNALLAFQDPDGTWLLVVRGSALYTVYECS